MFLLSPFKVNKYIIIIIHIVRAGDHVTFVYDNIVSQQMVFAIFYLSFKIVSIYIDHVPVK